MSKVFRNKDNRIPMNNLKRAIFIVKTKRKRFSVFQSVYVD